jgi:hypothetical protein
LQGDKVSKKIFSPLDKNLCVCVILQAITSVHIFFAPPCRFRPSVSSSSETDPLDTTVWRPAITTP